MSISSGILARGILLFTLVATVTTWFGHGGPSFAESAGVVEAGPGDISVHAGAAAWTYPPYYDRVSSSITYEASLQIIFDGGTGGGFYTPLLYAFTDRRREGSAYASVAFGAFTCTSYDSVSSCPAPMMPFVFGEAQTQNVRLAAQTNASGVYPLEGHAYGEAAIRGFLVFDMQNNPISATWTVTEAVAEPSYVPLCLGLSLLLCVIRARTPQSRTLA